MERLNVNHIEVHNVTIIEFGMLNEFIEENFEHVNAEYHYDSTKEKGIVRLYSPPEYIQEFMEAVRILLIVMETEV